MGLFGSKTKVYVTQQTQVTVNPQIDVRNNIVNDMKPLAEQLSKQGKILAMGQDLMLEDIESYREIGIEYLKYVLYIVIFMFIYIIWKR